MSIQSSINQAINLGGLLYTQTGGYKAKQEEIIKKKEISKAEEAVQKSTDVAIQAAKGVSPKDSKAAKSLVAEAFKDSSEAYKNLYKLNPTNENLAKATNMSEVAEVVQKIANKKYKTTPYDTNKAKDANKKAADRVNAMSEQKESAKRYMMLLKEDKQ